MDPVGSKYGFVKMGGGSKNLITMKNWVDWIENQGENFLFKMLQNSSTKLSKMIIFLLKISTLVPSISGTGCDSDKLIFFPM